MDWRRRVRSLRRLGHAGSDEHAKACTENNFPSKEAMRGFFKLFFYRKNGRRELCREFFHVDAPTEICFPRHFLNCYESRMQFLRARCADNINRLWSMVDAT